MHRRNWEEETQKRVEWIRGILKESRQKGIVFANSGGKDSALVGILCKMATPDILSIILPCESKRNFGQDREHALLLSSQFEIPTIEIDLTPAKRSITELLNSPAEFEMTPSALININPRLRMITLYAYAQSLSYLVAGTGNLSEFTVGYFTKWGDGAYDFNPIADLTASEIFEYLTFLSAPREIIEKAPSAGLYEGQTDESDMGISYSELDTYIICETATPEVTEKIEHMKKKTEHKRKPPCMFRI